MYAHCRYYIIWSMNTICCFSLVKYFDLPKFDVFTWVVETLYKNRLNRLSWNAGSVFFFFEHPGTYYSLYSWHFCMLLILSSGAFLHDVQGEHRCIDPFEKRWWLPQDALPVMFLEETPYQQILSTDVLYWRLRDFWALRSSAALTRSAKSGCIEIFCWLYHILATRNQLSHFWTKVGCRNAMSYTIFKNRVWWGLCFESFCSFLLNL